MPDLADELYRIIGEHRRRERRLRATRDREDEALEEEQRVAAWLERPEWRSYWDDGAGDFRVPEGWPPGRGPEPDEPDEPRAPGPEPEPTRDTFMHRMLRGGRP